MLAEIYLRDELINFYNIIDALSYIDINTQTNSLELRPCKGQKVFDPSFD